MHVDRLRTIRIVQETRKPMYARGSVRSCRRHARADTRRYRAYKPRPFTREERDKVTILFGGLHWRAERVIQGAMENLGYSAQVLPTATREDLLTGREVADIGQCCPTSFTTGNLANFLRARGEAQSAPEEVAKKYVYVTAGSCGACRFGQYHQSYELALRNVGHRRVPHVPARAGRPRPGRGGRRRARTQPAASRSAPCGRSCSPTSCRTWNTRCARTRSKPGETERAREGRVEILYEVFRKRPAARRETGARSRGTSPPPTSSTR